MLVLMRVTLNKARDENKYIVFDAYYDTHFVKATDMRSNLKLELNFTRLSLEPNQLEIGLLFKELGKDLDCSFEFKCLSLREGLLEKLISFPRRLELYLQDPSRKFDNTLVRHLYDVHQIIASEEGLL